MPQSADTGNGTGSSLWQNLPPWYVRQDRPQQQEDSSSCSGSSPTTTNTMTVGAEGSDASNLACWKTSFGWNPNGNETPTEDDDEEDGIVVIKGTRGPRRNHSKPYNRSCLVFLSVVCLLAVLIWVMEVAAHGNISSESTTTATPSVTAHDKGMTNQSNSKEGEQVVEVTSGAKTPLGDDQGPGYKCGGRSSEKDGNFSEALLGTCEDPIYQLESQSCKLGLVRGAVASDQPLCSQLGTSIMRDLGGNAIDASVTTALCLGVANPASSGVGGGAFMLIHADRPNDKKKLPPFIDARGTSGPLLQARSGKITEVIDSRETAPQGAHQDMFIEPNVSPTASTMGGLAIAVPGELKGLELAHTRHGRLSWSQVIQPVVDLARRGVPVSEHLAYKLELFSRQFRRAAKQETKEEEPVLPKYLLPLRKLLTKDNDWNHPLQEGDLMRNPALANTLEKVMNEGTESVFSSTNDFAQELADDIQKSGGIITAQELEDFRPTLMDPIMAPDVFGFALAGVPPPSSGGAAVIGIARFLATMSTPLSTNAETLSKHWFVEACRHVFAIRMSLSDPNFNTETVREAVRDLVAGDYIKKLFRTSKSDHTLTALSKYGGAKWALLSDPSEEDMQSNEVVHGSERRLARTFGYLEDNGTSHFSVVDKDGNAVAMTSTINTWFGSSVMSESTGIILNNEMDDFATPGRSNSYGLAPAESNFICPGKKPLSSMSPTLVFRLDDDNDDEGHHQPYSEDPRQKQDLLGPLVLAVGGSGGSRIITAVAQVLLNFVVLGMPLYESVIHARVHNQLLDGGAPVTSVERRKIVSGEHIAVSHQTQQALLRRNHNLYESSFMGVVQAIGVDHETGTLQAVSDVRKGGAPDGY